MSSRGPFGFRAKQAERGDKKVENPTGLSRKASITSTASNNNSKLPKHAPSLFSRNKPSKSKAEPAISPVPLASNIPIGRGQSSVNITSASSISSSQTKGESTRSAGLGISMENKTAQVNKAGKTRNVLRRRAPTIDSRSGYTRTESSASSYDLPPSRQAFDSKSSPEVSTDPFPNQVLGITAPTISSSMTATQLPGLGPSFEFDTSSSRMARYNSRQTPSPSPHSNIAPPTPNYGHDSGSSTRYSDSPSSHSHSSTPTSMTSQSPGISTPVSIPSTRGIPKPGQSRPPVSMSHKWRQGFEPSGQTTGLTAVRESGTSSSSSSTVKASGSRDDSTKKPPKAGRSSPLVPTFPAMTSPQKSNTGRSAYPTGRDAPRTRVGLQEPASSQLPRSATERSKVPGAVLQPALGALGDTPPTRPSRDGVPSLDMKKLHLDFTIPRPGPPSLSRSPSSASSAPGPYPRLASSPHIVAGKSPKQPDNIRTQEITHIETKPGSSRIIRDPSPQSVTSTKSGSRFLLFAKRTKSPIETSAPPPDTTEKSLRKGPAAGTGHEGYGKYSRRGRSGSLSTSASRGRSTSSTSVGRTPSSRKSSLTSRDEEQMDDFYRSRLEPKKIIGGGQSLSSSTHGSYLYLDDGAQSSTIAFSKSEAQARDTALSSNRPTRTGPSSNETPKLHALRHVDRRLPNRDGTQKEGLRRPVFDEPTHSGSSTPTLAARRSLHKSQLVTGAEPVKIPAPIDTRATAPSPALDSQNTYQSSVPQSDTTVPLSDDISEGHEGNWLKSSRPRKSSKSPKRWPAFFHRNPGSPKKAPNPLTTRPDFGHPELRAQVSRLPETRNVAYYELINPSDQGEGDSPQLVRSGTGDQFFPQSPVKTPRDANLLAIEDDRPQKVSMLLPSPPMLASDFPDLPSQAASAVPEVPRAASPSKPTSPVIPPPQPEPRKPRLQQVGRIPRVVSKRDRPHNPAPQSFSRLRPITPRQELANEPPDSAPIMSSNVRGNDFHTQRPILGIQTGTGQSVGHYSQDSAKPASAPVGPVDSATRGRVRDEFLAFPPRIGSEVSGSTSSGNLSVADITAVVPKPGAAPTEEEEWHEYNDFLDIMESPAPLASPKSNPYEKTIKGYGWAPAPLEIRKEHSSGSSGDSQKQQTSNLPPALPPNRKLPSPPKRSKLNAPSPTAESARNSDNIRRGSDDRGLQPPQRKSLAASSRYSTSSIESEADSLADLENPGPIKVDVPSHLRLELLTISKLLSFDRVLFSPAHGEILSNRKSRVLVLDGLGVDDWAFFCAQEYPDAQISNLSPTPRTAISAKNYEHHHYPSLDGPFPFPQNYFSAAVLRFPAATTEDAYANVIKEFRRVLSPSGYLEISVLDIDMVKMGNETRRALRQLKERKQIAEPQTSLKPLSDNIQKMLGGKTFENLKQCMLEIPVANHPGSSRVRSFNEKMEFLDEMPRDEDRTKHLPEIGRWWFSRCYESGKRLPEGTSKSIWDNQALLEECEAMETGFKMLLCYAQKPNKRRTLSL